MVLIRGLALQVAEFAKATIVIDDGEGARRRRSIDYVLAATRLRRQQYPVLDVEGYSEAHWVLIDLNNVVVHIFDNATREYYELERLWDDAGIVTA